MTDSSAYLFNRLKQKNLAEWQRVMGHLFNSSGAGLNIVRVPISSSDFDSTISEFSLDDVDGDTALNHFTMAPMERDMLPAMRDVLMVNPNVIVMLSPWSAPSWMKDSKNITYGTLRNEYVCSHALQSLFHQQKKTLMLPSVCHRLICMHDSG